MPTYIIEPGDCLSALAKRFGLASWKDIYYHPENARFRQLRTNPNIVCGGDCVYIPDVEPKEARCATESRHRFRIRRERTLIRLRLKDAQGEPLANCRYVLSIDGRDVEGSTSADGTLEQVIPADARDGLLRVAVSKDAPCVHARWRLCLGRLDPVEKLTGVQARLANLGYSCGAVDGCMGQLTEEATRCFQQDNGLTVDGDPGPQTQAALERLHGC